MGVINDFGLIGDPVRLLFGTPKMAKGLEIAIIATNLDIPGPQEIVFQGVSHTGGKMANGHTALGFYCLDSNK